MEKAVIEGLKTQENEKETGLLDEILETASAEQRKSAYTIEVELSQEAVRVASGEYEDSFVYNIPRMSDYGREDWGVLCDKMPYGCPYKKKGQKHVHTVGINITGALEIMNTYMGLQLEPSEPKIETFTFLDKGKMMTKAYWTTAVKVYNSKTDTRISVPYQVPVMQAVGGGEKYNEYGSIICTSKALRKAILMIVPGNLQKEWIDEYKGIAKKTSKPTINTATKKQSVEDKKKPEPELTPDEVAAHIGTITNDTHLTNWFTKNNQWLSTLKPEDRERILVVFNAKQEELSKQGVIEEDKPTESPTEPTEQPQDKALLTGTQLDAITKIAKSKNISNEIIKEMIGQFGVDKVAELSKEEATTLIAELQKEGK